MRRFQLSAPVLATGVALAALAGFGLARLTFHPAKAPETAAPSSQTGGKPLYWYDPMKGVLSLSDEQVERYRPLWEQHMNATKLQRDSAQAALTALHRGFEDHDRTVMRQYAPVLRRLAPDLEKRDKEFADKQLKPILTKDQAKSFDKWRDEQQRVADDQRKQYGRS